MSGSAKLVLFALVSAAAVSATRGQYGTTVLHDVSDEDLDNLPSFDASTPQNVSVYQGETARLMCSVNNLQGKMVTWQRKGKQYPLTVSTFSFISSGRYTVENDEDTEWNLLISGARRSDSGIYRCRVTTQTMLLVREVHLSVLDKPPTSTPAVTLGGQSTIYVEKGKELVLQCNATSVSPPPRPDLKVIPPEVEWFKDGNKINSHALSKTLITNQIQGKLRISTLTIEKTDMDNAGIYVCRTTDKTNAEVAVRILNVDKDNKKRGTLSGKNAMMLSDEDDGSAACVQTASLCLIAMLLSLQLT